MKAASVLWALLIGAGVIALAGSVLLPSTKRARIDLDQLRPGAAATTGAATTGAASATNPGR